MPIGYTCGFAAQLPSSAIKNNCHEQEAPMLLETSRFASQLQQHGVHAALRYLNDRTPHRYTGIFRFNGDVLRSEALFDRYHPSEQKGADTPWK